MDLPLKALRYLGPIIMTGPEEDRVQISWEVNSL